MTVAAKITPTELGAQTRARFVGAYFVAKLLNANGLVYTPDLQDPLQYVIDYELPTQNGYVPQVFGYTEGDISNYSDRGVGLIQKQVIFQHDNGPTSYSFDNVAVQWATGVVLEIAPSTTVVPTSLVDGTYNNVPVSSVSGVGYGLTVNVEIFSGAVVTIDIVNRGVDYEPTDVVEIGADTWQALGAHDGSGGAQGINITSVYAPENAGSVFCIAPTQNTVTLSGGNETGIYFNYKNFGFYNTST